MNYNQQVCTPKFVYRFNRYMVECELVIKYFIVSIRQRFNRYMVECELISAGKIANMFGVLIDTWWNVNCDNQIRVLEGREGFNRYMVECELKDYGLEKLVADRFNRYMVECE